MGGLTGKYPKIFQSTGATPSSPLVILQQSRPCVVYSEPHGTLNVGLRYIFLFFEIKLKPRTESNFLSNFENI